MLVTTCPSSPACRRVRARCGSSTGARCCGGVCVGPAPAGLLARSTWRGRACRGGVLARTHPCCRLCRCGLAAPGGPRSGGGRGFSGRGTHGAARVYARHVRPLSAPARPPHPLLCSLAPLPSFPSLLSVPGSAQLRGWRSTAFALRASLALPLLSFIHCSWIVPCHAFRVHNCNKHESLASPDPFAEEVTRKKNL